MDTATAIAEANDKAPNVKQYQWAIERMLGTEVPKLMRRGRTQAAIQERDGNRSGQPDRDHRPRDGGESLNDVKSRAKQGLSMLLQRFAVPLDSVPKEVEGKEVTKVWNPTVGYSLSPDYLPEGVKHAVLVSHNAFLGEFYEMLLYWNATEHRATAAHYSNTGW